MRIDVYTIFPAMFGSPLQEGLLGKAIRNDTIDVRVHDIRDYATDKHRQVDDAPFGGGPGIVSAVEYPVKTTVQKQNIRESCIDRTKTPSYHTEMKKKTKRYKNNHSLQRGLCNNLHQNQCLSYIFLYFFHFSVNMNILVSTLIILKKIDYIN